MHPFPKLRGARTREERPPLPGGGVGLDAASLPVSGKAVGAGLPSSHPSGNWPSLDLDSTERCRMPPEDARSSASEQEKLSDSVSHMLEEARMVLPGIQTLLGFQFAVVFYQGF